MPSDLNSAGDNPFFVGYHEQDVPSKAYEPHQSVSQRNPFDSIRKSVLQLDPTLTSHDLDYLMHLMNMEGTTEMYGKPGFTQRLRVLVERVAGTPGRVVSQFHARQKKVIGNPEEKGEAPDVRS
jgi:hypothetical protein